MDISLPLPIEKYLHAENSGDAGALSECFAPYATIRDAEWYVEGAPAITAWRVRMKQQHDHFLKPIAIETANGQSTLRAELSGKFPGSPMTAEFEFVLVDGQIASLQIHS